jgi:hypothetical protein
MFDAESYYQSFKGQQKEEESDSGEDFDYGEEDEEESS